MTQTPPPTAIETVSELKPCPFCGSAAELTVQASGVVRITCSDWKGCGMFPQIKDNTANAIAAWNRRSLDTADGVEPSERLNLHRKVIGMLHRGEKHAAVILSGRDLHVIAEALLDRAIDVEKASRTPNTETVVKAEPEYDAADHHETDGTAGVQPFTAEIERGEAESDAQHEWRDGIAQILASPPAQEAVTDAEVVKP